MSSQDPSAEKRAALTKRDVETFTILGGFLTYMAVVVVFAACIQAPGHSRAVNFGASLILLAIGVGMIVRGRVLKKRAG